jgi:hypothetical protein
MRVAAAVLMIVLGLAGAARAQTPTPRAPTDEALAARLASAAELADQNRRSEALNAQVNARNRAVDARNDATLAAYQKAQANYRAALAKHDADAVEVQAHYQKLVEAWKADVAACKAGEVKRCAAPATAQTAQAKPATTSSTASP